MIANPGKAIKIGQKITQDQRKNPKWRLSSYFHSSFSPISSPCGGCFHLSKSIYQECNHLDRQTVKFLSIIFFFFFIDSWIFSGKFMTKSRRVCLILTMRPTVSRLDPSRLEPLAARLQAAKIAALQAVAVKNYCWTDCQLLLSYIIEAATLKEIHI